MLDLIPLPLLRPGQAAHIDQLVGSADAVHRLSELGLQAGRHVEMVQPGTPCIVKIDGSKLCFRDGEAMQVLVRLGAVA
jgi:Fe2+ transport system protein FeoA